MSNSDDPFKSTEVDRWDGLLQALHTGDLFPQWENQGNHHRSPYVFRGTAETWNLQTSLERLGTLPERVEEPALRSFAKYVPPGSFRVDSESGNAAGPAVHGQRLHLCTSGGILTSMTEKTSHPDPPGLPNGDHGGDYSLKDAAGSRL